MYLKSATNVGEEIYYMQSTKKISFCTFIAINLAQDNIVLSEDDERSSRNKKQ